MTATHEAVLERHIGTLIAADQGERLMQEPDPALVRALDLARRGSGPRCHTRLGTKS